MGADGSVRRVRRALRSAPLALLAAVAAAQATVFLLRPRGGVIAPDPVDLGRFFTAGQIDRATDFRGPQLALYGAGLAVQAGVLAVLVVRRRHAGRLPRGPLRRPLVGAALMGAGVVGLVALATLPLDAVARSRSIDVGLVTGSWPGWAWDVARSTAISAAVTGAGCAAAIALMRRSPSRWWIPASPLVAVIGAALVFAGPLVLDPIFNRFESLPAGPVRSEVLGLADRAGVRVGDVFVVDASRRTTAANAYVTGIGSSKRVVLYDTLLRDFPPAETRLVVAHELAHVRYRDVPRGLLFLALVAPLGMFAIARLTRAWGPREDAPAGPATVPALLAAVALVALLIGTVSNQLSRRVEARADSYALKLTGDPRTFIAQQRRLALRNVSDPDPAAAVSFLLGTHPTARRRIGIGLAYERGARP